MTTGDAGGSGNFCGSISLGFSGSMYSSFFGSSIGGGEGTTGGAVVGSGLGVAEALGEEEGDGLCVGMVVKSIDGFKVNDAVSAIVRIRSHAPGDQTIMVVETTAGVSKTFNITLGSSPALP